MDCSFGRLGLAIDCGDLNQQIDPMKIPLISLALIAGALLLTQCVVEPSDSSSSSESSATATQLPAQAPQKPGFGAPLTSEIAQGSVIIREGGRTLTSFRTAKPNVEQVRWIEEQEKIAVKSRGNHGPATIQLFDSRTGRELGKVMAFEAANGPAWARSMAE